MQIEVRRIKTIRNGTAIVCMIFLHTKSILAIGIIVRSFIMHIHCTMIA